MVGSCSLRRWKFESDHFSIDCEPSQPSGQFPFFNTLSTGHDRDLAKGGCCSRHRDDVPFPDDWPNARGQLEWGDSSGGPHEAASKEDHGAWGCRGLIPSRNTLSRSFS